MRVIFAAVVLLDVRRNSARTRHRFTNQQNSIARTFRRPSPDVGPAFVGQPSVDARCVR